MSASSTLLLVVQFGMLSWFVSVPSLGFGVFFVPGTHTHTHNNVLYCTDTFTHVFTHKHTVVHVRARAHTHTHTHTHTQTHTHTHKAIQTDRWADGQINS